MVKRIGKATLRFDSAPSVISFSAVGSKKEKEGPLGDMFDLICEDGYFGESTWELAEGRMQKDALDLALQKSSLAMSDIDILMGGDLLNQCIASSLGLRSTGIPFLGLFGACSTSALGLCVSSMAVESGAARRAAAVTSSHFCSAERQFRLPLEYGGQRTPTSQWTATAAGAVIVASHCTPPYVTESVLGKIVDYGITDPNNMGAAMAPAAWDTISQYFSDTGASPSQFDLIVTGDLGRVGSELLLELADKESLPIAAVYNDCGIMLYDAKAQQVEAGGSGCGCSASVLCGHILPGLKSGKYHDVLYIATGALMSPTITQQKESIPAVAHLIHLTGKEVVA